MDRTLVAQFYRGKGYTVREAVLATGHSGNGHRVPLLCEGPLGNLAVFFGDAGGIDGPEIGAAKRISKDLGATPVLAAPSFTNEQRNTASDLGVVLLDADALDGPVSAPVPQAPRRAWPAQAPGAILDKDLAAHPWPDSGRPGGSDGRSASATFEVDDLFREPPATVAPTRPSTPDATPIPAARGDDGGLWKHARATTSAPVLCATPTAGAGVKFAWLNLPGPTPAPAPIEVEVEHVAVVRGHPPAPLPAPEEPDPAFPEGPEVAIARRALRRRWAKRAAWAAGIVLFAYLLSLWWFGLV